MGANMMKHLYVNRCFPSKEHQSANEDGFLTSMLYYGLFVIRRRVIPVNSERQFREEFMQFKSYDERLAFVLRDRHLRNALRDLAKFMIVESRTRRKTKSAKKAFIFSEKAKQFYQSKDMESALRNYNEAIVWVPQSLSKELAFYFASRSKVLFHQEKFNEAILDITEALNLSCPKHNIPDLLIRKLKCLKALGKQEAFKKEYEEIKYWIENNVKKMESKHAYLKEIEASDIEITKSQPEMNISVKESNSKLIGASTSVRLAFHECKGRIVKADKLIKEGEVIAVENPVVCSLDSQFFGDHCHFCLNVITGRVVPCPECALVRFCSTQCFYNSWKQYHKQECLYLEVLQQMDGIEISLRLSLKLGIQNLLYEPVNDNQGQSLEFGHDLKHMSTLCLRQFPDFQSLFARTLSAILLAEFFTLISLAKSSETEKLASVLLKMILQVEANSFTVYNKQLSCSQYKDIYVTKAQEFIRIGSALYGTASLLSHRCFPNVSRQFLGGKIVLISNNDIESGEEVTIDYCAISDEKNLDDRKLYIEQHRGFSCRCVDCDNKKEMPALKCLTPGCKGNMVVNEDMSNYCNDCSVINQNVMGVLWESRQIESIFEKGSDLLSRNSIREAEKTILECEKICGFFHPDHINHLFVSELLCRIYEAKDQPNKAIEYHLKTLNFEKKCSGENSFEVLDHLVKIVELLLKKSRTERHSWSHSMNAKKYLRHCCQLLEKIVSMEYKMATKEQLELIPKLVDLGRILKVPDLERIYNQLLL